MGDISSWSWELFPRTFIWDHVSLFFFFAYKSKLNLCTWSAPLTAHNNPAPSTRFWDAPRRTEAQNAKVNNENRFFYWKKKSVMRTLSLLHSFFLLYTTCVLRIEKYLDLHLICAGLALPALPAKRGTPGKYNWIPSHWQATCLHPEVPSKLLFHPYCHLLRLGFVRVPNTLSISCW